MSTEEELMPNEGTTKRKRTSQADRIEARGMNKRAAAKYLGCGESMIDDLVSKGKLTAIRYLPHGRFYYDRHELDLLIETGRASMPQPVPSRSSKYGFHEVARGIKK